MLSAFEVVRSVADKLGIVDKLKVVLVLDVSNEMEKPFRTGVVGEFMQIIFPIGAELGVESEVDQWWFAKTVKKLLPLTKENYLIPPNWEIGTIAMGMGAEEPFIMQEVIEKYKDSSHPVLVFFISGGCPIQYAKENSMRELIYNSAIYPIFWQFLNLGVRKGRDNYDILRNFHEIPERYINNTSIISMTNIREIGRETFYTDVFKGFIEWLVKVKELNIIGLDSRTVEGYPLYIDAIAKQMRKEMATETFWFKVKNWLSKRF